MIPFCISETSPLEGTVIVTFFSLQICSRFAWNCFNENATSLISKIKGQIISLHTNLLFSVADAYFPLSLNINNICKRCYYLRVVSKRNSRIIGFVGKGLGLWSNFKKICVGKDYGRVRLCNQGKGCNFSRTVSEFWKKIYSVDMFLARLSQLLWSTRQTSTDFRWFDYNWKRSEIQEHFRFYQKRNTYRHVWRTRSVRTNDHDDDHQSQEKRWWNRSWRRNSYLLQVLEWWGRMQHASWQAWCLLPVSVCKLAWKWKRYCTSTCNIPVHWRLSRILPCRQPGSDEGWAKSIL